MGPLADSREGPRHVRESMSTGETEPAAHDSGNGVSTDGTPILSLRGVGKNFGPVRALSHVDLDVPPGQVTALAGDNGAGKSVTIKTISGLWPPDEGEILWQGQPVHLHGPRDAEGWESERSTRIWPFATTWTSFRTCSSATSRCAVVSSTRTRWRSRRARRSRSSV